MQTGTLTGDSKSIVHLNVNSCVCRPWDWLVTFPVCILPFAPRLLGLDLNLLLSWHWWNRIPLSFPLFILTSYFPVLVSSSLVRRSLDKTSLVSCSRWLVLCHPHTRNAPGLHVGVKHRQQHGPCIHIHLTCATICSHIYISIPGTVNHGKCLMVHNKMNVITALVSKPAHKSLCTVEQDTSWNYP